MTLVKIPKRLPLIIAKDTFLLPGSSAKVPVTGPARLNVVKRFMARNSLGSSIIGVMSVDDETSIETFGGRSNGKIVGTAAFVLDMRSPTSSKDTQFVLHLTGICRFSLEKVVMDEPYPVGVVTQLDYLSDAPDVILSPDCEELVQKVREITRNILKNSKHVPSVMGKQEAIENAPGYMVPDLAMSLVAAQTEEKKKVLFCLDLLERLKIVLSVLQRQPETFKPTKKSIHPKGDIILTMKPRQGKGASDFFSDSVDEIDELHNKIEKAKLPPEVHKSVMRDLNRLKRGGPFSQENSIYRNYIEYVVGLPWSTSSVETIDITKARKDLDKDHYGMEKVKKRILEYLAVRQLKSSARGPVLCFVGPPGVGKTSIAQSIALTLGRKFERISLGGVNSQAHIRGHRRTYLGAMPGRIIQAIKSAGVNNPVILLDEADKMWAGNHGDPAAALLEVLDPLQNHQFLDHYLNLPFDLSLVTFIVTANTFYHIPFALRDRMETIFVSGYTMAEKKHIGEQHLLPKQLIENGISSSTMQLSTGCLDLLIRTYTLEAGVRDLERRLGALCRAVAVQVAEEKTDGTTLTLPIEITLERIEEYLGPPPYKELQLCAGVGTPGVAVGLAWTGYGGTLTVIEASKLLGGDGKLVLTGQLGKVMRESAQLALNWVRGAAQQYGLIQEGEDLMTDIDVHIHVPEGAVSKEGPSAGITIATALVSLFADVPLITDLGITGELTLRGVVLPVGGIKEKMLAAHRFGLKKIILPKQCVKDLFHVPQNIKDELSFTFVSKMEEVVDVAFGGLVVPVSGPQTTFQSQL